MSVVAENTLERLEQVIFDQSGTRLIIVNNESGEVQPLTSEINRKNIHFYFCLEGSARFEFGPHYSREIQKQRNYFMYNPESDMPFNLRLSPGCRMVFLFIPLESLHKLFPTEPLKFFGIFQELYQFRNFFDGFIHARNIFEGDFVTLLCQQTRLALAETERALARHADGPDEEKPDQEHEQREKQDIDPDVEQQRTALTRLDLLHPAQLIRKRLGHHHLGPERSFHRLAVGDEAIPGSVRFEEAAGDFCQ